MILVCHSPLSFEQSWQAGLYRGYARQVPAVFVEPDPTRPSVGRRRSLHESVRALHSDPGRSTEVVRLFPPGLIPGSRFRAIAQANRWIGMRAILQAVRAEAADDVVLVIQRPDLLPTVRGLPARLRVYEIVDDYAALAAGSPATAARIARAHRKMLKECDLVWATSSYLARHLCAEREDALETTNGVDFSAFADGNGARSSAITTIPSPRVGIVGNLNDRIDWELVEDLCRRRPEWHFVIVGPAYYTGDATVAALARLTQRSNVHRVPGVPPEALPGCVAPLDVCLIPYRLTAATLGINPLKVYQYLAAGKPVVATPLPALAAFGDLVSCCATAPAFDAAIVAALAKADDVAARRARQERARMFDWERVAADRLKMIRQGLLADQVATLGTAQRDVAHVGDRQ